MKRKCYVCNKVEIKESMGGVLARDVLSERKPFREICGKCALVTNPYDLEKILSNNANALDSAQKTAPHK